MRRILLVDDMAICRDPIAACLRAAGYQVSCAANGREALDAARSAAPDLVLLDVAMPVMDGLEFLHAFRREAAGASVPVILLTAVSDRSCIVRAGAMGVRDYLLKSRFSMKELLSRVQKYLPGDGAVAPAMVPVSEPSGAPFGSADVAINPAASVQVVGDGGTQTTSTPECSAILSPAVGPAAAPESPAPAAMAPAEIARPTRTHEPEIPALLSREQTLQRVERFTESKTLAGVILDIVYLANSPNGSVSDLVALLRQDAVLAARVLHVANSAAFVTKRPRIMTIEEAVRNIGVGSVRNVALSAGIFDRFPPDTADGFNQIRCWQHSFAVAALLDHLTPATAATEKGVAHLVGLCHDLGEIVLHQCFAEQYSTAVEYAQRTGKELRAAELSVFGLSHGELNSVVLQLLALPADIIDPIREFHGGWRSDVGHRPIVERLRMADAYANGLMLTASAQSTVWPVTQAECRRAMGRASAPDLDGASLRHEVLTHTGVLARLSSARDQQKLFEPVLPRRSVPIWYARHRSICNWDPLHVALASLADVEAHERLPASLDELGDCRAIVVAAPRPDMPPFSFAELDHWRACGRGRQVPVMYLAAQPPEQAGPATPPGVTCIKHPVSLAALSGILTELTGAREPAARVA